MTICGGPVFATLFRAASPLKEHNTQQRLLTIDAQVFYPYLTLMSSVIVECSLRSHFGSNPASRSVRFLFLLECLSLLGARLMFPTHDQGAAEVQDLRSAPRFPGFLACPLNCQVKIDSQLPSSDWTASDDIGACKVSEQDRKYPPRSLYIPDCLEWQECPGAQRLVLFYVTFTPGSAAFQERRLSTMLWWSNVPNKIV